MSSKPSTSIKVNSLVSIPTIDDEGHLTGRRTNDKRRATENAKAKASLNNTKTAEKSITELK
jgi:hypothetical protein